MYSPDRNAEVMVDHNMNTRMGWGGGDCDRDRLLQCDKIPRSLKQEVNTHIHTHGHDLFEKMGPTTSKTPFISHVPGSSDNKGLPVVTSGNNGEQMTRRSSSEDEEVAKSEIEVESEKQDQGCVCGTEAEDRQDTHCWESIQKRVCLVKLYAWIKEEMSRTAVRAIADHLYENEKLLLSRGDHESIWHCSVRREAVEQLLKKVLMGPCDIYDVFIRSLKLQEEKHIAEKLMETHADESEIEVFQVLEQSSLQLCARPNHTEPRFTITNSDHQTLLYYLNNKTTIDAINDQLLSRFLFSIREHTNICQCSLDAENRVRLLIDTMKECSETLFDHLCEILVGSEMGHVIRKLEKKRTACAGGCRQRQKRKNSPDEGDQSAESSSQAKRLCVDSSVEVKLVSSMQKSSSTLRLHAIDQLGFDVENINKGSIVIQLTPQSTDSWQRLEANCLSGKIKDFIPVVYNNDAIYDLLEEGEYRLQFTIYTLPTPTQHQEKKVMFHLETEQDKSKATPKDEPSSQDNPVEEHMDLLCEELEISRDLLSVLKSEKLVADDIKDHIDKQGSRAKKIKYLLKEVAPHGMKGYKVLKEFIREDNEDLYKALTTREEVKAIDDKLDTAAKVTKKSGSSNHRGVFKKEVFFTGTVVLNVKKQPKGPDQSKENLNLATSHGSLDISCPEIIDPVCHFNKDSSSKTAVKGEVTMVLEEAWATEGAKAKPKREILIGKRKGRDEKSTATDASSKRLHSDDQDDQPPCGSEDESATDLNTGTESGSDTVEEETTKLTKKTAKSTKETEKSSSESEETDDKTVKEESKTDKK